MIKRIEGGIAARGLDFDYITSIKEMADELELKGIAFEKKDGSVKVVAEGEEENLVKFAKKLEKGSFLSTLENFYVHWGEPTKEFTDFSIINPQ